MKNHLIVMVGPTAVGKTATCITLAQHLGTEIISADARQCYEKMNIGVAKPTPAEQAAVPHHLIDFVSLERRYSAGAYEQDVLALLPTLWKKSPYLLLTGGSGLYIDAVCQGLDPMPMVPSEIIHSLDARYQRSGLEPLRQELATCDPTYYAKVDKNNPMRIMRALSIYRATKQPFSTFRAEERAPRDFYILKIGLQRARQELYDRINQRVDLMVAEGLWEEATSLASYKALSALATIGYREIFDALEGKHSSARAIELIKQHTRHYAKRQLTYFRKDPSIRWFHPDDLSAIVAYIRSKTTL